MAPMLGKLYEALLAGGVDKTRARAAAEEVAEYTGDDRLARIRSDLTVLKWMVSCNLALTVILVGKALLP